MQEHTSAITIQGNPLTLIGPQLKVGDIAPDFDVIDVDLKPVVLSSFKGQVCILSSVPSLDTPICDLQTRRFNHEASALSTNVRVLTLSMDLPFAQKRWCAAHGLDRVFTLSDHRHASFGQNYGVLIKELRLLARAVFVVDTKGILQHVQIVPEIKQEPDYAAVIQAVKHCL
ncbi:MAG: thiol peroxidase [Desulfobacterales bacterium]|nr:thiol peroxidase [Desulfobacterales bacterium]